MRFFWVLALCAGVCAGQTNTVDGTGAGSGWAKEATGAGSGFTAVGLGGVAGVTIIDVTTRGVAANATQTAAVLNSLCTTGAVLFFPSGTYTFSSQINLGADCGLVGFNRTAVLRKGYNSGGQFIAISGAASDVMVRDLEIDGNAANFSGGCISDTSNGTNHAFLNNYIHDCEGNTINVNGISANSYAGVTGLRIEENDIACGTGATSGLSNAIAITTTVQHIIVHHNRINCSASVQTFGAAILMHSSDAQDSAGAQLSDILVDDNDINPPVVSGVGTKWAIEIGGFQGLAPQNVVVKGNSIKLLGASGGMSLSANLGLVVQGNSFASQGFALIYTPLEMIGNFGTVVSGNHFVAENSASNVQNYCMVVMDQGASVTGNTCDGFGENGTTGSSAILLGGTHANNTISTMSMTGGIISVTTTTALSAYFLPGITVYISGVTPAGYNGYCKFLNTGYSRSGGTFQCATGVASDAGAYVSGGIVSFVESNNTVCNNTITFPVNTVVASGAHPIVGIEINPNGANEVASNNLICSNTIVSLNNTPITGEYGISIHSPNTIDSTTVRDNIFVNLGTGIQRGPNTNAIYSNNRFINVTTNYGGSAQTGEIISTSATIATLNSGSFTSANASGLQLITGLTINLQPGLTYNYHCHLIYSQATPSANDQFGISVLTTAPTRASGAGLVVVNTTANAAPMAQGTLTGLATTTPTAVVTFTPGVATAMNATLDGSVETGAGLSSLNFYVTNGTAADVIVISRDSGCTVYSN